MSGFAIVKFEQQNKNLLKELGSLKVFLRCANRSRGNAKADAVRAESELKISEKVNSVLFEDIEKWNSNSKKRSLKRSHFSPSCLKQMRWIFCLNRNWMTMISQKGEIRNLQPEKQISSETKKKSKKTGRKLQVMKVKFVIQRAEAIQLIQAVDGKQYEKHEKCLHALLTHANHWDWKDHGKCSCFSVKRDNIKNRLSTIYYPIAKTFDKDPLGSKNAPISLGQLIRKVSLLHRRKETSEIWIQGVS